MRWMYAALISLCCMASSLQGNAGGMAAKQPKAPDEYRAFILNMLNGDLSDCYTGTILDNAGSNYRIQKLVTASFTDTANGNTRDRIFKGPLQNISLQHSGRHAQSFRSKLIFPQHYYW